MDKHDSGTTDFDTCFLQTDKFDNGQTHLIRLYEPETESMEYYDVSGPSYGRVDVPKCWNMKFKWFVPTI